MTREFLLIQQRAPTTGDFSLNSLSNNGRLDISCRFLNAALFTSYSLREDTAVHLLFRGEPNPPVHLLFDGSEITGLHPDHRSIAGYLRTNLNRFETDQTAANDGVSIDQDDLEQILDKTDATPVLLQEDGEDIEAVDLPDNPLFIIGEHTGVSDDDLERVREHDPVEVSLSGTGYQAQQVASFLNIWCDRL